MTLWAIAYQALLSMKLSEQEYWSGFPPPPGDLLDPGIEPGSPAVPALHSRVYLFIYFLLEFSPLLLLSLSNLEGKFIFMARVRISMFGQVNGSYLVIIRSSPDRTVIIPFF